MERVTVDLDDSLQEFIDHKVEAGEYSSPEDVVLGALRDAQIRESRARLNAKLQEALDSGDPVTVDADYWARKRARLGLPNSAE
jgi:putative addiction module CopG family antidote